MFKKINTGVILLGLETRDLWGFFNLGKIATQAENF